MTSTLIVDLASMLKRLRIPYEMSATQMKLYVWMSHDHRLKVWMAAGVPMMEHQRLEDGLVMTGAGVDLSRYTSSRLSPTASVDRILGVIRREITISDPWDYME